MSRAEGAPTMIIPSGTEIQIDVHGQLSVRTPGNLVIQNSGHYGEIESVHGSIRIESGAEVEAVLVRCAETCYVQGSLTSWRVKAKAIHLEEKAQARIVLQETEGLEIGKNAHMVGNFASEKELFLLFSRFAQQLRSLPFYFERKAAEGDGGAQAPLDAQLVEPPSIPQAASGAGAAASTPAPPLRPPPVTTGSADLPDQLFFAQVLLEREARNEAYGASSSRVVDELVKLLRDRDLETLRHTHRTLFERIVEPNDDLSRARELIETHFDPVAADG